MEDAARLVEELLRHPRIGPQIVFRTHLPALTASFSELDPPLSTALGVAVAASGAERLWSHQVEGLEAARRGENVLVTTPTASGKSLIFQLPVLEAAALGTPGRALFLYPLKALAQDQRSKLAALTRAAGLERAADCAIYDGDTPKAEREAIRRSPPRVLISNPDMLHLGILGSWSSWSGFLSELRWIVLDELHTYRGIFGSHFHHVLQRLLRLCRALGASPSFIASSATAGNAREFAEQLTGEQFRVVERSGAPREGRHLLFLEPATSPYTATLDLLVTLLQGGAKTIVFTKARRITELLYSWLRRKDAALARRVASYRAGFLAAERRRIEHRLFVGELDGVISTSALEMGIDVGGLDACILVGYPGSVMATWQRSGRVGRSGRESLTALVALPDALDQYLLQHPEALLERPLEQLIVDPDNETIVRGHLACAAAERPLSPAADRPYLERHAARIGDLLREEVLFRSGGEEIHAAVRYPHGDISLRGGGREVPIVDDQRGTTLGTVDGIRVQRECHPGAIYLHGGRQYLVRELDLAKGRVLVEPVAVDYFTMPLSQKETRLLEVLGHRRSGELQTWLARLEVTEEVVGFERKQIFGQEVLGQMDLELPPSHFETEGLLIAAPAELQAAVERAGENFMGSLHAAEHAAISLFPILALCDRGDIGGISIPLHPQVGCGVVFIYDGHAGGIGIARRGFRDLPLLLAKVRDLLEGCDCEAGCPSCVQSPKCGNGNRPLDKGGAAHLLRLLLGDEPVTESAAVQLRLEAPAGRREVQRRAAASAAPPAVPSRREPPAAEAGPQFRPEEGQPAEVTPPVGRRPTARGRRPRRPRLPRRPHHTVLFDLETRRAADEVGGWGRSYRMGLVLGVVLHLQEERFATYFEADVHRLIEDLKSADLVVGFNCRRFDYDVLAGYTGADYNRLLPTLDLLEDVRRRLGKGRSLDHLAGATLGAEKSGDGLQSIDWARQGRLDLVESYCKRDVELLRDLYLYGRREGHVCYRDDEGNVARVLVEW